MTGQPLSAGADPCMGAAQRMDQDGPGSSLVAGWHQDVQACFEAGVSQAMRQPRLGSGERDDPTHGRPLKIRCGILLIDYKVVPHS